MEKLIDLEAYPVGKMLPALLKDKTTKENIMFATSIYGTNVKEQITVGKLTGMGAYLIQPRVAKTSDEQAERTKQKAEVFTPSWICNKMNNHLDCEWFGKKNVFNTETENSWIVNENKVSFTDGNWENYVDSKRLEITCGEAPYVVSRYDASTGDMIKIKRRIGLLDRKLRVVDENVQNEDEWLKWVYRAFQSVYGYEFQGDNLLIARVNLLLTFVEYLENRWHRKATENELKKITNIIVWNFWQMDGITGVIPFGKPRKDFHQMTFFDYMIDDEVKTDDDMIECRIYDWKANRSILYNSLKGGR